MTTTAKLADGTVLNFPDGTPQEVIQGVVKQHMAGEAQHQAPGIADQAKRQLGLTGRATLGGLMTIPNAVGDAANQLVNYGIEGGNAISGALGGPQTDFRLQSMSKTTGDSLDKVFPKPETGIEKGVNIASEMLTSGPGMAPLAKLGIKGLEPLAEYGGAMWLGKGGAQAAKSEPLTTAQIKAASQAAYKASEEAGLVLGPEPLQRVLSGAQAKLAELGYRPTLQPKIATALAELSADASRGNVTLKGVDGLRQVMVGIARDGNPSEKMMAGKIIARLDDEMANLGTNDVIMGNADEGLQQLGKARELWRTQAKADLLETRLKKATDQASTANSGGNLQNKLRQEFGKILNSPKLARLFNAEEKASMQQIVDGTWTQNTLRNIGRLAPSSNSWLGPMMAMMGGGTAAGGAGLLASAGAAAVPAIGAVAKSVATRSTAKDIEALSKMVRSAATPMRVAPQEAPQALIARALLQGSAQIPASPYAGALLNLPFAAAGQSNGNPGTGPRKQP